MKAEHPYTIYPNFRYGRNRTKTHTWKGICIHWSAGHGFAPDTARYINREGSSGWYNFVIDKKVTIMCVDPASKMAGHAKPFNEELIGICIAQPVVYLPGALKIGKAAYLKKMENLYEKLKANNYNVKIIELEDSDRYPYVFTLDQELSDAVAELTEQLCNQFNLDKTYLGIEDKGVISHPDIKFEGDRVSVMHHHHLTDQKFDCEPWLPELNKSFEDRGFSIILNNKEEE